MPKPPQNEEDDPIVEYEDEFGRARTGRRSEIPRHLLKKEEEEEEIEYVLLLLLLNLANMILSQPVYHM